MIKQLYFSLLFNVIFIAFLVKNSKSTTYNKHQVKSEIPKKFKSISSHWFKSSKFRPHKRTNNISAAISPRNIKNPENRATSTKSLSSTISPTSPLSSSVSGRPFMVSQNSWDTAETSSSHKDKDSESLHDRIIHDGDDFKLEFVSECNLPTTFGNFRLRGYRCTFFESESLAADGTGSATEETNSSPKGHRRIKEVIEPSVIYCGDLQGCDNVLVRVHDQCQTSEVMGSLRCDCKQQFDAAMGTIINQQRCETNQHKNDELNVDETKDENRISNGGAIIYLPQEGRGIGLANKIACYNLQDQGHDTVDANKLLGFDVELRNYDYVPYMLRDMAIKSITLLTNNPFKINRLKELGVKINETKGLHIRPQKHNFEYLKVKQFRMHHKLNFDEATGEYKSIEDIMMESDTLPKELEEKVRKEACCEMGNCPNMNDEEKEMKEVEKTEILLHDHGSKYCYGKQSVIDAVNAIKNGKMVLVVDDENRENEGDLIIAAEKATPADIAFIVRYSSGILCIAMEEKRLEELNLPPMVINNEDPKCTAFTVSVDCKHGTTSGISASDRAKTFQELANPNAKASDFTRPGHVFPLKARKGGVLERGGHTEATVDLMKMAGLFPAGVLCEVVDPTEDGLLSNFKGQSMARRGSLKKFAKKHDIVLTSIADMVAYRLEYNI